MASNSCPELKYNTGMSANRAMLIGIYPDVRFENIKDRGSPVRLCRDDNSPSGYRFNGGGQQPMAEVTKSMFNKKKWLPLVYLPFKISHMCCSEMKKKPLKAYQSKTKSFPILGTLAEESRIRKQGWIRTGCNLYDGRHSKSQPMSFWTEQDVLAYIVRYNVEIPTIYGDIVAVDKNGMEYPPNEMLPSSCKLKTTEADRTGCIFCGFGLEHDKGETRFQRIKRTHPKQYEYSMEGGEWIDNPDYVPDAPEYDGIWKNWNPERIWVPSKKGLGFRKVFEMVNEIYGDDFYRYE